MVTHGFNDGLDAGVADTEALARHTADENFALGRTIQRDVADDHVLFRCKGAGRRRIQDQFATAQALAEVVVGVAFEREGHALGHERTEALACTALEGDLDGVLRQAGGAALASQFSAGDGSGDAVDVADRQGRLDLFAPLNGRSAQRQQLGDVQRLVDAMVLDHLAVTPHFRAGFRLVEDLAEVDALGLPVLDGLAGLEPVGATHHLGNGAEAQLGHDLADLLGDEAHEVDRVLRFAGEALAQFRVLGGDTDRAGVQVAHAHHDAAQ